MIPTPHTDAFLAKNDLRLETHPNDPRVHHLIVNAKGHRVLRLLHNHLSGRPHVRFIINTNPSSTEFPNTIAARRLFDTDAALAWFDALVEALHQDLGDYTCSIRTSTRDTPYFESKGFTMQYAHNRRLLVKTITDKPAPVDTRPTLPQTTIDLLTDLGMVYHPKTDELVTYNKTNRRRHTLCRITWDRHVIATTFNTSDSSKDYPRFLKDALSRDEHLKRLEDIVKSIATVHGPMRLVLYCGRDDRDFLEAHGYDENRYVKPAWFKTIAP